MILDHSQVGKEKSTKTASFCYKRSFQISTAYLNSWQKILTVCICVYIYVYINNIYKEIGDAYWHKAKYQKNYLDN